MAVRKVVLLQHSARSVLWILCNIRSGIDLAAWHVGCFKAVEYCAKSVASGPLGDDLVEKFVVLHALGVVGEARVFG
ncbi:hypothetical protein D9M71_600330 [compost metagenome]